jgi:hypothetical protein
MLIVTDAAVGLPRISLKFWFTPVLVNRTTRTTMENISRRFPQIFTRIPADFPDNLFSAIICAVICENLVRHEACVHINKTNTYMDERTMQSNLPFGLKYD